MAENRSRFPLYLHLALGIVSSILGSFGMLGYTIFGSNVPQLVTDTLQTGVMAQLVRVTLLVAVLMTYPLQLYPVIEIAESIFFTKVHSRDKSHMSEIIAGPSVEPGSNPGSPTDSTMGESQHPVLDPSGSMSTSMQNETEVLIPKDTEELQYKVQTQV